MNRYDNLLRILGIALYVLAVVTIIAGAVMALSILNAPGAISTAGYLVPALSPFLGMIDQLLTSIGIALFVGNLFMGLVLFAAGLLLRRSLLLSQRVQQLETALAQASIPLPAYAEGNGQPRPAPSALKPAG